MNRTTVAVLLIALLAPFLLPAATAWASIQDQEHLLINGRVYALQSRPLAPILRHRGELERVLHGGVSTCSRGYVGTWHIEGDRLYLVSLRGFGQAARHTRDGEREPGKSGWRDVPLTTLFQAQEGPIEATWYSGTLRVPLGRSLRADQFSSLLLYERELRVGVRRGRVVSRSYVDNRVLAGGRCDRDLLWASPSAVAGLRGLASDPGTWRDAREIPTPAFRETVTAGRLFRTRGILKGSELWIPGTPVTQAVRIPLRGVSDVHVERSSAHVEIEATWSLEQGDIGLRVRWLRVLPRGETIHHPDFPLPGLRKYVESRPAQSSFTRLTDSKGPERLGGGPYPPVQVRGVLKGGEAATVCGVQVVSTTGLIGKHVVASGLLEKWVITQRLLDLDPPEVRPFRARGPGTYWRLTTQDTGKLAGPKAEGK